MKQIVTGLIMLAFAMPYSGCKKGEEDPGISLRSRTARLTGEWELVEFDYTETFSGGSTHHSFNGSIHTETSGGDSETWSYSEEVIFEKDGSFEVEIIDDGDITTINGAWYWAGESEELELKDKEAVVVTNLNVSQSGGGFSFSSTRGGKSVDPSESFVFERLSNNEIVVLFDETQASGGSTYSKNGFKRYEKVN